MKEGEEEEEEEDERVGDEVEQRRKRYCELTALCIGGGLFVGLKNSKNDLSTDLSNILLL